MEIYSKLKQYYRYRRNWKKFNSRQAKGGMYKNASEQLDFYSQFIKKGDLVNVKLKRTEQNTNYGKN